MAQEVVIEVGPNGDVIIEGNNIAGADCVKLTAEIEKAVGDVVQRKLKPDFHRSRPLGRKAGA